MQITVIMFRKSHSTIYRRYAAVRWLEIQFYYLSSDIEWVWSTLFHLHHVVKGIDQMIQTFDLSPGLGLHLLRKIVDLFLNLELFFIPWKAVLGELFLG